MSFIRQGFYFMLSFSFPWFWLYHSAGLWAFLYAPIQAIAGTEATGWPSFFTAFLLYLVVAIIFEFAFRALKNAIP